MNNKRQRTVVITQGRDPTIVVHEGKITEYPVPLLDPKLIVDTNGAGDSFVGGFFSQLIVHEPLHVCGIRIRMDLCVDLMRPSLQKCVHAGQYCARVIIQHTGCTFPENPEYDGFPLEVPAETPDQSAVQQPSDQEAKDSAPADQ